MVMDMDMHMHIMVIVTVMDIITIITMSTAVDAAPVRPKEVLPRRIRNPAKEIIGRKKKKKGILFAF